MGRSFALLLAVAASACVSSDTVECASGASCPAGTVCRDVMNAQLPEPVEHLCVRPDDIEACADKEPAATCTPSAAAADSGRCYDGVCLPGGCGNSRIDPDEVCDDSNSVAGDGCSASCRSNESCGNGVVDPVRRVVDPVTMVESFVPREICDDGNTVGHDGCDSACKPETPLWVLLQFGHIEPRIHHAAAYDSARRVLLMFGGVGNGGPLLGTIESDGTGFQRTFLVLEPVTRQGHAMAYDVVRRRTVLFGGVSLGDTWEWDGTLWRRIATPVSPPQREFHEMVFDATRGTVVMFGGRTSQGDALDDTWEWDGVAWKELASAVRPEARALHVMAYDPVRGVTVMAGGGVIVGGSVVPTTTTWELRSSGWVPLASAPSPALVNAAAAFDPVGRQIIAYGGAAAAQPNNTWTFDGQTWTNRGASQPGSRVGSTMTTISDTGEVLLIGGNTAIVSLSDEVWSWTGTGWTLDPRTMAAPILGYRTASLDPTTGTLVMFGGVDSNGVASNMMSTLVGTTWTNAPVADIPARYSSAMAFDIARRQHVLFGGYLPGGPDDRTYLYSGGTWTRSSELGPVARRLHAMAYDVERERVVLFGGLDGMTLLDDTWEWNGQTWTQLRPVSRPSPRYNHVLFYDPVRKRILCTGGSTSSTTTDETWEWDGSEWTRLGAAPLPSARDSFSLAWDGSRRAAVGFSGATGTITTLLPSTIEWNGSWSELVVAPSPEPRAGHFTVPMPGQAGILIAAGGRSALRNGLTSAMVSGNSQDVWRMRYDGLSPYEVCAGTFDNDGDGLSGCADPDCWVTCTPACPPGATCSANLPRCGDQTCAAPLENCRNCPGDCTCPALCGDTFCDPTESAATCPGDC